MGVRDPPRMFLGSVNGVAPSLANAADGSFPFSRFIWNVTISRDVPTYSAIV